MNSNSRILHFGVSSGEYCFTAKPIDASLIVPPELAADAFCGPPPLIPGEDRTAYEELLARMTEAVRPANIIDEFSVRNLVYLVWDVLRLRRLKAKYLEAAAYKGLEKIIRHRREEELVYFDHAGGLARRWARQEPDAAKEVNEILAKNGLTMDSVMAQRLVLNLDKIERIDRMSALAEARYNAELREIDRRRDALAQRLRHAARQEIENSQIKAVADGEGVKTP
jgi:hypothetical protein